MKRPAWRYSFAGARFLLNHCSPPPVQQLCIIRMSIHTTPLGSAPHAQCWTWFQSSANTKCLFISRLKLMLNPSPAFNPLLVLNPYSMRIQKWMNIRLLTALIHHHSMFFQFKFKVGCTDSLCLQSTLCQNILPARVQFVVKFLRQCSIFISILFQNQSKSFSWLQSAARARLYPIVQSWWVSPNWLQSYSNNPALLPYENYC